MTSCADWDSLCDHLRATPWEGIFKLSEFCEWFSAAFVAAIVCRNHYFHLYQQNKSSESKVKFRQASNYCKRVFEAAKLVYANQTKESITSQKLGSQDFGRIANSVLNKGKSAIPLYSTDRRYCLLHLIKQNRLLKTFLRILILTPKMVKKVITNLDSSKTSGPDCIPVVVWKVSLVFPVFKNVGEKSTAKN